MYVRLWLFLPHFFLIFSSFLKWWISSWTWRGDWRRNWNTKSDFAILIDDSYFGLHSEGAQARTRWTWKRSWCGPSTATDWRRCWSCCTSCATWCWACGRRRASRRAGWCSAGYVANRSAACASATSGTWSPVPGGSNGLITSSIRCSSSLETRLS